MSRSVLILGGYGNFGKRIAAALVRKGLRVIVAGRSGDKAFAFAKQLPDQLADSIQCDVLDPLDGVLEKLRPAVVVNTCGPFQLRDYSIAEACIRHKTHYIDLADGRDFVTGIKVLNERARKANVAVIAGASTVPGLSSAVLEHFKSEFLRIEQLKFGISPGQKAERGLATTEAILSYTGKPLKPFPGSDGVIYGWQDLYRQDYPVLGKRWMANCDIPDLVLLPEKYGIECIRFSAGLELGILHLGLWALSWMVRAGIPLHLVHHAPLMLRASNWFDRFGSADGGMHIIIKGQDQSGEPLRKKWFIIARDGDGPHIPTVPSILLAERLVHGRRVPIGAMPCVGLVSLESYMQELKSLKIETFLQ